MSRTSWRVLSLAADAVVLNAAIVLAFALRFGWPIPPEHAANFDAYQQVVVPLTVVQILVFFMVDLYDPMASRSGPELLGTVAKGVFLGTFVLVALSFLLRAFAFPRTVIPLVFVAQIVLLWGWRRLVAKLFHVHWPERRVVLVGSSRDALAVAERLSELSSWGYRLVGVVCDDCEAPRWTDDGVEWLPSQEELPEHLERLSPDQIIVTTPSQHREILEEITLSHRFEGDIYVIPQLYEIHLGEVNFSLLHDIPLLRLTRPARPAWQQGAKVVVERVTAAALLVLLAPVLLLIALGVILASGRPVFYEQERLGKDFRPFTLVKFRTMVPNAEECGPVLATEDDPRVTPIGRLLRSSRLDELPQFLNVARGDMSFVGPRPERGAFVEEFLQEDSLYEERFRVRPGITGLAQVSGSYATTPAVKLRFDLMYVYHQSLALDLRILMRTVQVVLTGRGAM